MSVFADNIAAILKGLPRQEQLAEAVGVSQSTVSRWLTGSQPKPEALVAVAQFVGVTVETLITKPFEQWRHGGSGPERREWLRRERAIRGWTPAALAQIAHGIAKRERIDTDVSAKAVEDFEAGSDADTPKWLRLCEMAFQEGEQPSNHETAARDDLVYIRQVDISYGMGLGADPTEYPETNLIPFNLGFIQGLSRAPLERLFIAGGHGDSMEPTILRHDQILIDSSERALKQSDLIWALSYAGAGMIKRLRRAKRDGRDVIVIHSDNPAVPPEEADPEDIHIVGKVIWIGRRM